MKYTTLDRLEFRRDGAPVFPDLEFTTPWSRFDTVELAPGECHRMAADGTGEWGYILLDGHVELRTASAICHERIPGLLLAPAGRDHELLNPGARSVRLLRVRVEVEDPPAAPLARAGSADPDLLVWREAIHGGAGRIATRHVWRPDDFASSWTFMDHAVLGPRGSVGYHYHDALEECFIVTAGTGYMTIAERTFAVGPGSITFQGIREGHGLYNPGDADLDFLRIAVAQPDEEYTTVDLHDDLSSRIPSQEG